MASYELNSVQVIRILDCVSERRTKTLRQVDSLRKMRGSIDRELYDFFKRSDEEELRALLKIEEILNAE